ncbi:hypothetical protein BLS_010008 [Venturia inaequalis]|uniref:Uncharacterized protein n=1 Tax=Venturia inaequalis TaxID=5025 RepID=A0A8H3U3Y0_VENIN|nr:hypothetical protein BLS_010008 [Venturia inaequalis]
MLIRQLRPWRPNSCRPRILPQTLPRAPLCANRFFHYQRPVKVSQASVLFESSRHATPDNLIASIEPISPCTSIEGIEDSYEQAILLFTPSFAQALAYDPQFLPKVLNRLFERLPDFYQHGPGTRSLRVAVAVVDRLPMRNTLREKKAPNLTDHGSEGVSYVVSAIPELGLTSETPAFTRSSLDEAKTLSLLIGDAQESEVLGAPESETSTVPVNMQKIETTKKYNIEVQVPLASTVFQAGQSSILSLSSWAWRNADGRYILEQKSTESPSHVSFKFPFAHTSFINTPLIPLTPPRKIVAGMGNVIRQVERDTEYITASQELEPAVSSYFTAKDLPPSAVNAWALIIPGDLYLKMESEIHASRHYAWLRTGTNSLGAQDLHELWQREPSFAPHRWFNLFRDGARLHRVLSGGGGWGKKAGLISLDPDSSFRKAPSTELGSIFADGGLLEAHEGMLGNAAKVGDLVQFYICPPNTRAHSPPNTNADLPPRVRNGMRLEVGTLPSTIDTMPYAKETEDGDGTLALGHVVQHLFGFMSEKGVSIARVKLNADLSWSTSSRTKISVPFSRLQFRGKTINLLFTSFQGKITPIQNEELFSKSNKIRPHDWRPSDYPTRQRKKWRQKLKQRRLENPVSKPLGAEEQLLHTIHFLQVTIGRIRSMQICKPIAWADRFRRLNAQLANLSGSRKQAEELPIRHAQPSGRVQRRAAWFERVRRRGAQKYAEELRRRRAERLVDLRRHAALPDDFDYGSFIAGGPIIAKSAVANKSSLARRKGKDSSTASQRVRIRKLMSSLARRKGKDSSTASQRVRIRKLMSSMLRKVKTDPRYPIPARVVSESTRASWTSLQRRRARGNAAVKMRRRYEESLDTVLIRKHFRLDPVAAKEVRSWDKLWLGQGAGREKKVETAEMKAKRKENEEEEKKELLEKVRELLKGF